MLKDNIAVCSGSSVDRRTSPTNSGEGELFNKEKKHVPYSSPFSSELKSQDQYDFMPNATTSHTNPRHIDATSPPRHDQTYLHSELDDTYSYEKRGDRKQTNSNLKAHNANPFGEANSSPYKYNTGPSSSSQNPFLVMSDATNIEHVGASESENVHDHLHSMPAKQQQKGGMSNNNLSAYPSDGMLGPHSSLASSINESPERNPFKVGAADIGKVHEHYDHHVNGSHHIHPSPDQGHWSMPSSEARTHPANTHGKTRVPSSNLELDPFFTLESEENQRQADANSKNRSGTTNTPTSFESNHTFSITEQGNHRNISNNSGTDRKSGSPISSFSPASEFSTQDHMHNSPYANSKNSVGATNTPTSGEPYDIFSVTEQGHHIKTSSNSGTDKKLGSPVSSSPASQFSTQDQMYSYENSTKSPQKRGKDVKFAMDFTDDDIPISSFPNHGHQASDGAGQHSSAAVSPGSEKQNPPLQVMERPENPTTTSNYRFPSHVFDRHKSKSNTQWSTASNESLFSIQMGNTSFSGDTAWMNKSGELDKTGDINLSGPISSNQPPLPPQSQPLPQPQPQPQRQPQSQPQPQPQSQPQLQSQSPPQAPSTKFNDISQSTAKDYEDSKDTEEKAAETMREMEAPNPLLLMCKPLPLIPFIYGEKHHSSKHGEEKKKQQKQPEQQTPKAPAEAVQTPKSTANASHKESKSWLSCFSCC
ncbi:hypothetical protein VNO78_02766 [Psophocarpus tetragonolobus]|uniref:Uncharacterized protein n=1 Tax=Psophocarpus tetragonolobus TaxID=3891 RepID=A0AAN9XVG4_PSOTE